jgi:glyoxylase-like metal-dependent hydrolase (beta-lactamase superfamily II)
MKNIKFSILHHGWISSDRAYFYTLEHPASKSNPHPRSSLLPVPTYSVLIQHPDIGNILMDTGPNKNDFNGKRLSPEFWDQMELVPSEPEGDTSVTGRLAKLGLTADDIDLLILSHCHWDHMGGISEFAGTKAGQSVWVGRADYEYSLAESHKNYSDTIGGFVLENFHVPGLKYKLIECEKQIAEGLHLLICPGHTPGVLCVLAETSAGNYIFVSDAVSHSVNYIEPYRPTTPLYDSVSYRRTVERIHDLERQYDAKIVFGHDDEVISAMKHAPYFYGE